jgi:ABC-type bacteriocin/lantibiotic exporter with double-glycine peptidase domain
LVESLSAIKFIKQFAVEHLQLGKLGGLGERFVQIVTRFEMLGYIGSTASTATAFLGGTLTTLYGGYLVIQGQMTIGSLVAFSAYQSRAFSPLQVLMDLYLRIERAGVSLARIFEFLDIEKEHEEREGQGKQLPVVHGAVEFRQVSFAYEANQPVLRDVSFCLPAGGRLTILGPSGTGKTTVIDLLTRLYEPTKGAILLDGHNLKDLDPLWLRGQIVVISHEPFLFHASLLENLRYASPEASLEEVTTAAETVGLHEFALSLLDGYDSIIGERGARLSAGQKQRIALARAVLKHPKVLVLDEAMSGLDVTSEADVRETLEKLMGGRTTITVTHRMSSLRQDDPVIVLEKGQVVWEGRYGDLAALPSSVRITLLEEEAQPAK